MAENYDFDELYANTYTEADREAFEQQPTSDKMFLAAWALSIVLGLTGAERFYLGRPVSALVKLFFTLAGAMLLILEQPVYGLLGVTIAGAWTVIDLLLILTGTLRDRLDRRLSGYQRFVGPCAAVTALVVVGAMGLALIIGSSLAVGG